eukprot:EG_transcript_23996
MASPAGAVRTGLVVGALTFGLSQWTPIREWGHRAGERRHVFLLCGPWGTRKAAVVAGLQGVPGVCRAPGLDVQAASSVEAADPSEGCIIQTFCDGAPRATYLPLSQLPPSAGCYVDTNVEGAVRLASGQWAGTECHAVFLAPSSLALVEAELRRQRLSEREVKTRLAAARQEYSTHALLQAGWGNFAALREDATGAGAQSPDLAMDVWIVTDDVGAASSQLLQFVQRTLDR